jgi:uncharacterized glyoxalase superfamily protein PhnB
MSAPRSVAIMNQSMYPIFRYADAPAAIAWLERAFGFTRHMVVDGEQEGTVAHAELALDGALIMLGGGGPGTPEPGSGSLYIAVDDPDALFARASGVGAEVVREPVDQPYGSREFTVRDPEGNVWSFGTYRPSGD